MRLLMIVYKILKNNQQQFILFWALMILAWFLLPGGPRPASWVLLLLSFWLIFQRQIKLYDKANRRIAYSLSLLIIPVGLSAYVSYNPQATWLTFIGLVLFIFVALAMRLGFKGEQSYDSFQGWFFWVYIFFLVDGAIQFFIGASIFGVEFVGGKNERLLGASGDDLHYGLFIAVLMPLALWNLVRKNPLVAIGVAAVSVFLVALSGARTSVFFVFLGLLILFFRFFSIYRVVLVIVVIFSIFFAYQESSIIRGKFEQTRFADLTESKLDQVLSWRISAWKTGLNMLDSHPYTGVGANAFEEAYPAYRVNQHDPFRKGGIYHAHQLYVGLAAETGWPGLVGFLLIIVSVVRWWRKAAITNRKLAAPYAATLGVIIFPINSQPVLYTLWWFPLVLLLFVAMVSALSHDPYAST